MTYALCTSNIYQRMQVYKHTLAYVDAIRYSVAATEFLHPCNQKTSVRTSEEVETPDARLCESDVEDTASEEANTSSLCTRDCKLPSCMSEVQSNMILKDRIGKSVVLFIN